MNNNKEEFFFDLNAITDGLTIEEKAEFISKTLTPEAAKEFKAKKQAASLQERYNKEIQSIDKLPQWQKAKKMSEIKASYRAQGLQVY